MAAEVGLPAELADMPGWKTVVSSLCPSRMPLLISASCLITACPWAWPVLLFQGGHG